MNLSLQGFVEEMLEELFETFRHDRSFNKSVFNRQVCPVSKAYLVV